MEEMEEIEQLKKRIIILETILFNLTRSDRVVFSKLIQMQDGKNIQLALSVGTKIGTATGQKLGFWNATPVVQPSSTGESSGFVAGGGTTVTHLSTFTGNSGSTAYTISDIIKHLKAVGILLT